MGLPCRGAFSGWEGSDEDWVILEGLQLCSLATQNYLFAMGEFMTHKLDLSGTINDQPQ